MLQAGASRRGAFVFCLLVAVLSACEASDWCYTGSCGPEHWSTHYPKCAGASQSPIDIVTSSAVPKSPIESKMVLRYSAMENVTIKNTGHSIEFASASTNGITLNGQHCSLKQIHFHWLSEHTIDNKSESMEMHLFHICDNGSYAVVGVMMRESSSNNAVLQPFWSYQLFPNSTGNETQTLLKLPLTSLLPSSGAFYYYEGSATTPDCSPASWMLYRDPIDISTAQIAIFKSYLTQMLNAPPNQNNRPIQPTQSRTVYLYANPSSTGSAVPLLSASLPVALLLLSLSLVAALLL